MLKPRARFLRNTPDAVHVRAGRLKKGDVIEGEGKLREDAEPHHGTYVNLRFEARRDLARTHSYSTPASTLKLVRLR